jgi:hypothetical protein
LTRKSSDKRYKGINPEWLNNEAKQILLTEGEPGSPGYEEALNLLPKKTQRLIREIDDRRNTEDSSQDRRGSPASDINTLYPTILYLILNGVSSNDAWDLIRDRIPGRDFVNAKRQLNRGRDNLEKAAHEAASAIVDGKPRTFETAYKKLQHFCE